ncbi:hypothetical protein TruAng_011699 [Truncatella angustata]|nr:hypothetical protein TruAng_011699 [Truncatella angustata]
MTDRDLQQATQFLLFGDLPAELRLEIWNMALESETTRRVVPFSCVFNSVLPTVHLRSPLLEVNSESRDKAKKFFDSQVKIHAYQPGHSYMPVRGRVCGLLYLNFKRDVAIFGKDFGLPDHNNQSRDLSFPEVVPRKYISENVTTTTHGDLSKKWSKGCWTFPTSQRLCGHSLQLCCWSCYYMAKPETHSHIKRCLTVFRHSNLSVCCLLILSGEYREHFLLKDLSTLTPEDCWKILQQILVVPHNRRCGSFYRDIDDLRTVEGEEH